MPLALYNTLTRTKEEFRPIDPAAVRMYTCGPTVYNYAHIGNYRAYLAADVLRRSLLYLGFGVRHIMNLTDVDDKTIRDSQKEGKSLKEFTEFYSEKFFEDVRSLNILAPERWTRATDNVDAMTALTETLLAKGLAYRSQDGSTYFDIKKFPHYGRLAHLDLAHQKENASGRIKNDEYEKDNAQDFALWKAWDEADGDVYWNPSTTLGRGRPGWHIECSAMSMRYLGEELDIHTGGVDLIFPHHENEIAQSEGATGKQFVRYWLHNEWVLVDGKKMAKSAGNFYTLRDVIARGLDPLAFRLWVLMASYRTSINFVWDTLEGTENALARLRRAFLDLGAASGSINAGYQGKFKAFLEDDLDTPQAVALTWDLLKDDTVSNADKRATLLDFDRVLGLGLADLKEETIPEEIKKLALEREQARTNKDFKKSDELRDKMAALGWEVKDSAEGQKVSKI